MGWSWPERNGGREAEVGGGGEEEKGRSRGQQENHILELTLQSGGCDHQLFLKDSHWPS